jgi:hypothetical protein
LRGNYPNLPDVTTWRVFGQVNISEIDIYVSDIG